MKILIASDLLNYYPNLVTEPDIVINFDLPYERVEVPLGKPKYEPQLDNFNSRVSNLGRTKNSLVINLF